MTLAAWWLRDNGWWCVHVFLTAILIGWATVLYLPPPTFATGAAYRQFAAIVPNEEFWATGFLFAGLLGMAGCWAAFPRPGVRTWRVWLSVASGIILAVNHGMIALLMAEGNLAGTGWLVYTLVMLLSYALAAVEASRVG